MSVKEIVKNEIDRLPKNLLQEILDFIQFLEARREMRPRAGGDKQAGADACDII